MSKEQIAFFDAGIIRGSLGSNNFVVGQLLAYTGSTAPSKWLLCDGTICLISTYQNLYNVIGNSYGGEVDAGTFALPDLRKRVPMGALASSGFPLNSQGGAGTITIVQDNLPAVSLTVSGNTETRGTGITATSTDSGHTHDTTACPSRSYDGIGGVSQWIANSETPITSSLGSAVITTIINDPSHSHGLTGTTSELGSAEPITIQPPYVAVNYIIYVG